MWKNECVFHNNVAATPGGPVDQRDFACEWKIYKARPRQGETGRGVWGRMDTCVPVAESLYYLELSQHLFVNIILLLTGYILIQNKKLKKKKEGRDARIH